MSRGLAVQMSNAPIFTDVRPKLLHAVPVYRPRPFVSTPVVASPASTAPVNGGDGPVEALWICQECNQYAAVVAGCYCLTCVQDHRACLHCGLHEPAHHRANRLRHRTAVVRTTYVCLGCASQHMCWNQPVPLSTVYSPRHQPQTVYNAQPLPQTQAMQQS
jgi:hypothetical protein